MIRDLLLRCSCLCLAFVLCPAIVRADGDLRRHGLPPGPAPRLMAGESAGPDIQLSWSTINGGGGVSANDWLALIGAVGQPEGAEPLLVVGYEVSDSLWALWDFPFEADGGSKEARVTQLALAPISPNPNRGVAEIAWSQPRASLVRLKVYDVQGRAIAVLADGPYEAGEHHVTWRANARSGIAAAGIYLVRLQTLQRVLIRRIVVMP